MSKMGDLYIKVSADPELQSRYREIMKANSGTGADVEAVKAELTAFASEQGFDVSWDEIRDFFRNLSEKPAEMLSEAELDMVAGGKKELEPPQLLSLATLGIFCGAMSAYLAIQDPQACKDALENLFK